MLRIQGRVWMIAKYTLLRMPVQFSTNQSARQIGRALWETQGLVGSCLQWGGGYRPKETKWRQLEAPMILIWRTDRRQGPEARKKARLDCGKGKERPLNVRTTPQGFSWFSCCLGSRVASCGEGRGHQLQSLCQTDGRASSRAGPRVFPRA